MHQQQTKNNEWLTGSTGLAFGVVLGGSLTLAFAPTLPVAVGVVATATIMWGVIGYLHEDYQRKLESEKGSEKISSSQQEPIVRYENTLLQQYSSSPHLKDKAGTPPDSPSMRAQRSSPDFLQQTFAPNNLFFTESETLGTGGLNVTDYTNHLSPHENSSQSSATSQSQFTPKKLEKELFGDFNPDSARIELFPESPFPNPRNSITQQGIEVSDAPPRRRYIFSAEIIAAKGEEKIAADLEAKRREAIAADLEAKRAKIDKSRDAQRVGETPSVSDSQRRLDAIKQAQKERQALILSQQESSEAQARSQAGETGDIRKLFVTHGIISTSSLKITTSSETITL